MPRKSRIYYPGAIYHVMVRGNRGENIFYTDQDRYYFYRLLKESTQRFNYLIHIFCLMSNHVHLVVQVNEFSLSKIMHYLNFRYAQRNNVIRDQFGHVFQGRYKAILVEDNSYLTELVRYIHLNPVNAGIVVDPVSYKWSSHRSYLKMELLDWLHTDLVENILAKSSANRLDAYLQWMKEEVTTKFDIIYLKNFDELVKIVCQYYSILTDEIISTIDPRKYTKICAAISWLALKWKVCSILQVAKYFNRSSEALRRAIEVQLSKPQIYLEWNELKDKIENGEISRIGA